jgi:hypothetical protein
MNIQFFLSSLLFSAKCSFFLFGEKNTQTENKKHLFFYSKNTHILNRLLFKDNNTKKKRITTTRDDDACYCYYFCCDDERTDDD